MSNWVLGISCYYHDSAAAIVRGGEIIAAAQEERFSRKKHDPRFPSHAIDYCLEEAGIAPADLAAVVFYDNPVLTFDRIVKSLLTVAPEGAEQWQQAAPNWLGLKARVEQAVHRKLGTAVPVLYSEHHFSHAASAFYPSPFEEAAILTLDGVGEWATTAIGVGRGTTVELLEEIRYPHSLGLLYSAMTSYCGFKVNSGEYKLMGLASYGEPRYAALIREHLIDVRDDGSYRLDTGYFGFMTGGVMTNDRFHALFGGPPREPESRITRREMDLAASVQAVTEDVMLKLARHARELTGMKNIVLAGGVALNCVANGRLWKEDIFDGIWLQPAAGDAGCALGAALLVAHEYFDAPRTVSPRDAQQGSYLGPRFSNAEVREFLEFNGYPYHEVTDEERAAQTARLLSEQKVVGYLVGRMEFGPRSLGARSILGDARDEATQSDMNLKIKYRESFRPFAPSVLAERVSDYFDLDIESPYMLLVAPVQESRRTAEGEYTPAEGEDMLPIINRRRSDIPAVTHVDYSARIQTVNAQEKPDYHAVLSEFEKITGCAVVVNTSFNVRGEPIVCTPADAYRCFMRTQMDALVLENFIVLKSEQPEFEDSADWRSEYELD